MARAERDDDVPPSFLSRIHETKDDSMTTIAETTTAAVPFHEVPALTEHYLKSLPYNENVGAHVVLRAWIAAIVIECEVLLKMTSVKTTPGLEVIEAHWRPLGGEPCPEFKGTLCAEPLYQGSCRLTLSGEYVPPGGVPGAAFDALFGHHIAEQSIRDLLQSFKTDMERLYAAQTRGSAAVSH